MHSEESCLVGAVSVSLLLDIIQNVNRLDWDLQAQAERASFLITTPEVDGTGHWDQSPHFMEPALTCSSDGAYGEHETN